ncbi:MAG: biopolymer transporter ExbD [Bacteroidetes bacterium]|nr:MAG: biopolymer transporter ExbD [Bacteroidota bacterium]
MNTNKKRRKAPSINTGSMADIAFLLLIFFLVTTTIMEDSGIRVKLPVWEETPPVMPVSSDNILSVKVNAQNALMVEGEIMPIRELKEAAKIFITNPENLPDRPSSPKKAAISLQNDRSTNYEAYLEVYDQLVSVYNELWETEAQKLYGKSYELISKAKQKHIKTEIPMVISEAEPTDNMADLASGVE